MALMRRFSTFEVLPEGRKNVSERNKVGKLSLCEMLELLLSKLRTRSYRFAERVLDKGDTLASSILGLARQSE